MAEDVDVARDDEGLGPPPCVGDDIRSRGQKSVTDYHKARLIEMLLELGGGGSDGAK